MKILGDRRTLLDAVGIVSSAVAAKTTKPILGNILLSASDDGLTLYATDQEIAVRCRISQVKVERPGQCLVPARELGAILRELTDPTINLNADARQCKVEGQSGTFSLAGADVSQFPEGFQESTTTGVRLPAHGFVDLVRRTAFATAKEATRFAMNGVLCQVQDGRLQMVGTDGRRLALAWRSLETRSTATEKRGTEAPRSSAIVPVKGLQAVVSALPLGAPAAAAPMSAAPAAAVSAATVPAPTKDPKGRKSKDKPAPATDPEEAAPGLSMEDLIEIRFGTNQIVFRVGTTEVFARLIDGEFPQYDAVIPKSCETTVEIERARFESVVRQAAIFRETELRAVRMTLGGGSLRLDSELANVGSASVSMDVDMRGPGGHALFNPDYILEFLRVTPAETLRFEFSDESSPGKFVPEEEFVYIIMPITGA